MENPWRKPRFVEGTHVLETDWDCVKEHNDRVGRSKTRFICDSIPEPFIGNKDTATVVLLGKNPGHSDADAKSHADFAFRNAMFLNMRHELDKYPFYPLNPSLHGLAPVNGDANGPNIFMRQGVDYETIANRLMVIEWIPYHSET
jgi:hypothetical protein